MLLENHFMIRFPLIIATKPPQFFAIIEILNRQKPMHLFLGIT